MDCGFLRLLPGYGDYLNGWSRRWSAGQALFLSVIVPALFVSAAWAGGTKPIALASHTRLQQELAANQSRDYRLTLNAGQAVTLRLEQDQNRVALRQIAPANTLPPRSSDAGRFAFVEWTLIAEQATTWIFRVQALAPDRPASYRIELDAAHPASADDRLRARTEAALSQAETQRRSHGAGKVKEVSGRYQTAIAGYRELHDACGEQAAQIGLARYQLDRGQYADGQTAAEAALRLHCTPDARDLALRALALHTLSSARFYQGDFAGGVRFGKQSLALSRRTRDLQSQEGTLGNLVGDYAELGESDHALDMAHAARKLALQLGDRRNALMDQGNIASIHLSRGELMPALAGYRKSLALLQAAPDPYLEGLVWTNLGMLYNVLGDNAASLDAYARAIALWAEQQNQPELSAALWNQGFVFLRQEQNRQACAVFQRALKVTETANLENDRTHVLEGLGRCAMAESDWPRARDYLEQSLTLAKKIGNPAAEIPGTLALGDLALARRDFAGARTQYAQAYKLALRYHDRDSQPSALAGLARADRDSGNLDAAQQNVGRALALIADQRRQIADPGLRTDYFAD
ncbi:MAG TPA: tetratricopeptide repeat protein, partial [Gammaproteobacteria bacterium]|nr:tetratricopeptide repeat protein [Gammaproteobacteria bacterium]